MSNDSNVCEARKLHISVAAGVDHPGATVVITEQILDTAFVHYSQAHTVGETTSSFSISGPDAASGSVVPDELLIELAGRELGYQWNLPDEFAIRLGRAIEREALVRSATHLGAASSILSERRGGDIGAGHFKRNTAGEWVQVPKQYGHEKGVVILYHSVDWPNNERQAEPLTQGQMVRRAVTELRVLAPHMLHPDCANL